MLAVTTDMKAPKDVSAVAITVSTNNTVKYNMLARVSPDGDVLLPATLAIVEPSDPNATIRIRAMAFQDQRIRVLRDVRTTVPRGRLVLLKLPLTFADDGLVSGDLPPGLLPAPGVKGPAGAVPGGAPDGFDPFAFAPGCPADQTWIDGECKDAYVDPSALPEYSTAAIGPNDRGGGCFDTSTCFAASTPIDAADLDADLCSVGIGGLDPGTLNFAVMTPDVGHCVNAGECYVPIDKGAAGWREDGGRAVLPRHVCKLLSSKGLGLRRTTSCATKTESMSLCADRRKGEPPKDRPSSFIKVRVEGHVIDVPCEHLDRDLVAKPSQFPTWTGLGGISVSTGVSWGVRLRVDPSWLEGAGGDYPILPYVEGIRSVDPDLSIDMMVPLGPVTYSSVASPVTASTYHRVSVEKTAATSTGVTFRLRGLFEGTMKKVDGSASGRETLVPFDGGWSLLVTLPRGP